MIVLSKIMRNSSYALDKEKTYSKNDATIYTKEFRIYIYYNVNLLFL